MPGRSLTLQAATYIFAGLIGAWLLLAAAIVDVDSYDGLSAICNARYFLGHDGFYIFDRGPLMAWVQMPAEWVKGVLALHPLDVRVDHATMALLHGAYLAAVYGGLVRHFGRQWSVLVAFATSITSYMFFAYAPFISHDLAPGALLLWMLIWSEDFVRSFAVTAAPGSGATRLRLWLALVAVGALAPLIKQTYGVFWIAVFGAHLLTAIWRKDAAQPTPARALAWLAAGAGLSALLTWIIYGVVFANWAPEVPLWLRPYRNLQYLAHVYDGTDVTFPLWIYLRNFWAYGRLTTLLVIPGLVLSLRGSAIQRRIALAWVIAVVFVHAMPLREVRYLAFAAPLSAFLVVPAVRLFSEHRLVATVMGLLLVFDLAGASQEASRIGKPFYRKSELRALVAPLSNPSALSRPLYFNTSMLSFVAPDQSPLAADRYHRVFHVAAHHVAVLYGYALSNVRIVPSMTNPPLSATAPEGSILLFSNGILAHGPTWQPRPPGGIDTFIQGLGTLETIVLRREPSGAYSTPARDGQTPDRVEYLLPVALVNSERAYPLQQQTDGTFLLRGQESETPPDQVTMRAFVVQRRSGQRPPGT